MQINAVYKMYTSKMIRANHLGCVQLLLGGSNDAFKLGLKWKSLIEFKGNGSKLNLKVE